MRLSGRLSGYHPTGTAILALPLVLGRLADLAGIRWASGVVAVLLIGVFLIVLGIRGKGAAGMGLSPRSDSHMHLYAGP